MKFGETPSGRRSVQLMADVEGEDFLTPGWKLNSSSALPTFTTSRPRENRDINRLDSNSVQRKTLRDGKTTSFDFLPTSIKQSTCSDLPKVA